MHNLGAIRAAGPTARVRCLRTEYGNTGKAGYCGEPVVTNSCAFYFAHEAAGALVEWI